MNTAPVVIAHRGASGYLPEHTLPAKALAHGMGADFLEQDVVASRDGRLIVFHDLHLDQLTDVARALSRPRAAGRASLLHRFLPGRAPDTARDGEAAEGWNRERVTRAAFPRGAGTSASTRSRKSSNSFAG